MSQFAKQPRSQDQKAGSASSMLDDLAKYDTPTICNVIELFGGQSPTSGYIDHRIRCWFDKLPPMVGYACTATFRSAAPASNGSASANACASKEVAHLVESFSNVPGPAVVVFQDLDDPPAAACFGDIACNTYQAFGAVGFMTSGAGRDLAQVEALNFPVFASSAMCSHGYGRLTTIGEHVRVGGVMIYQGDLLHGDRNGVIVIPHKIAPYVADVAGKVMEVEEPVLQYLKKPQSPTVEGYRAVIQEMQDQLKDIQANIASR